MWFIALMSQVSIALYFVSPREWPRRQRVGGRLQSAAVANALVCFVTRRLTHKGCILWRLSSGTLADVTDVLLMRQCIDMFTTHCLQHEDHYRLSYPFEWLSMDFGESFLLKATLWMDSNKRTIMNTLFVLLCAVMPACIAVGTISDLFCVGVFIHAIT